MAPGDAEAAAVSVTPEGADTGPASTEPVSSAPAQPAAPDHAPADHHAAAPAHSAAPAHTPNGSSTPSSASTTTSSGPLIESTQIRRAIAIAQKRTDLNWSVFIGTLTPDPRTQAEARHAELGPAAAKSVLIAVDPAARRLEIVTGTHARAELDDRSCALAAAAMTSSFAVRDLDGGIAYGILAMVEHVRGSR